MSDMEKDEEQFQKAVALCDKEQYDEAVPILLDLSEKGYAVAQYYLGDCYRLGAGLKADKVKAAEWYRKSAEQGYADSQFYMGLCYAFGDGVQQDHAQAAVWYRRAAEQGHVSAQNNLGTALFNGQGVRTNGAEAIEWWEKAAAQGHKGAQEMLSKLDKKDFEGGRYFGSVLLPPEVSGSGSSSRPSPDNMSGMAYFNYLESGGQ